jgi:GDP-4-dehydro-6-deoxy-D-mannose reductase
MEGEKAMSQRAFLTGGNGFVGTYLQAHLAQFGDEVHAPFVEITDRLALRDALEKFAPTTIYHLAGQANVGESWVDPGATFTTNALGTLQLLEATATLQTKPRVIVVSSAEVYGVVAPQEPPISESRAARPTTPYGSSKLAAEIVASQIGRAHGIDVIVVRPFNHIGPGQAPSFVVSGVARRIAEAERDGSEAILIGNTASIRDFTDVRDVVAAYRLLALHGNGGATYNVGSGVGQKIADLVDRLISLAKRPIRLEEDPAYMRPNDVPRLICDASLLRTHTNWLPEYKIEESLDATLQWWRSKITQL